MVSFTRHSEDPPKIVFHAVSVNTVHQLGICNYWSTFQIRPWTQNL